MTLVEVRIGYEPAQHHEITDSSPKGSLLIKSPTCIRKKVATYVYANAHSI